MKTSQRHTSTNGAVASMFSREDSHASRSPMPGSAEARTMTATSGRICAEQYRRSDPLGSLVRMLLESPRWSSRVKLFKWESRPLYSERRTLFAPTNCASDSLLSECAPILKVSDIQSNRLLFRLEPLEHHTEETEFLSWLKTPTAWDYKEKMQSDNTPHSSGTLGQKAAMGELDYLMEIVRLRIRGGANLNNTDGIGRNEISIHDEKSAEPYQGESRREQLGRAISALVAGRWEQFPTQSPIHRGDDGLSFRMDSLSLPFNKWRKEALQALGNAIVPQVMYEIFRALASIGDVRDGREMLAK